MEFASFLAGERWSDHPSCTHPLLAQLARQVNDHISDADRQQLVPLIPPVVGRMGDDRTWLTLPVTVAWPILEVPEATQRVLAAGLVRAEQLCATAGPDLAATGCEARAALDLVPGAVAWLERLRTSRPPITPRIFADRCAPRMVRHAADGIVASGAADRDSRLRALLEVGIAACPAPTQVERAPEVAQAS
jgi:hypothetical protein